MIVSDEIKLILPWPPSVNRYWRHVGKMVKISAEGRAYRNTIRNEVIRQLPTHNTWTQKLAVWISAAPPDRRRRDLDNILKALLDSLEHAEVYNDDFQIDEIHIQRAQVSKPGTVTVNICETSELG